MVMAAAEKSGLGLRISRETAFQSGRDLAALKTQLYRNAYPLGARLRKWFAVDTMEEVMALGQVLYRAIGVDMQGDPQGEAEAVDAQHGDHGADDLHVQPVAEAPPNNLSSHGAEIRLASVTRRTAEGPASPSLEVGPASS